MDIAAELRAKKAFEGITLKELVRRTGFSVPKLSALLCGKQSPRICDLNVLFGAMGCHVDLQIVNTPQAVAA